MTAISKISLGNIVYSSLGDEDKDAMKFDQRIRYAYRAAEFLCSWAALDPWEDRVLITKHRAAIPVETVFIDGVQLDGIRCFYTGENFNLLGKPDLNEMCRDSRYKYNIVDNAIEFNWNHQDGIDGKLLDIQARIFRVDKEDGFLMVPKAYQEAIIAFIRKEEALEIFMKTKGQYGRGLYQEMSRDWDRLSINAEVQVEQPSRDEMDYVMNIFNTKVALNVRRGFVDNQYYFGR